jgi:hypothetical protein
MLRYSLLHITLTQAYVVYIQHTSFRLYHCHFPKAYLYDVYYKDEPGVHLDGVTLKKTKADNLVDIDERGEWFDIFVALIQYLLSGESKVGYLNNLSPGKWNPIHKVLSRGN